MKYSFGFRSIVVILFIFLYLGSLLIVNSFFNMQQKQLDEAYRNFQIEEILTELSFQTRADSLKADEIARDIRQSHMAISLHRAKTQTYSSLIIFLLLIVSIIGFIAVFYYITRPLKELQAATTKIRNGDFSVFLPLTGIKEMRQLKQSFNDMSNELDSTQQKLLTAEKEMIWKELSRMLAHEIKNPLTPIRLSVQRMEEMFYEKNKRFDEIFPESVAIINQEVNNLMEIVQSFSGFAKISNPEYKTIEVAKEIRNIVQSYSHKYDIKLKLEEKCYVKFDQTHFYQVITNVLQNAIDASENGETINVEVSKCNNYVIILIADQGKGVKQEDVSRIFEPYFTRKMKGTGMGLAVVNKLCEINKAHIRFKSVVNEGSRFELIIEETNENTDS